MYSANVVITWRILYFFLSPADSRGRKGKLFFFSFSKLLLFTHLAVSFYVRHLYSTGSCECWKSVSLQGISVSYRSSRVRFATWQLLKVLAKSTHAVAANIMQLDCIWWLWMENFVGFKAIHSRLEIVQSHVGFQICGRQRIHILTFSIISFAYKTRLWPQKTRCATRNYF